MMTTIEGIKTIPPIPDRGMRYLSVNAASVDIGELWQIAKSLGFSPELVQIQYRSGGSEIHALLWQGRIEDTPLNMDDRVNKLADQIDNQSIRYATGKWTSVA